MFVHQNTALNPEDAVVFQFLDYHRSNKYSILEKFLLQKSGVFWNRCQTSRHAERTKYPIRWWRRLVQVSLFAASIRLQQVPDEWRKAIVTPIFKGGRKDRRDPTSYRPIALTSCVARVMENILNGKIFDCLKKRLAYLWTSIRISTKSFNSHTALPFSSPMAHGYGWGSQYPIGVFGSIWARRMTESQSPVC